MPGFIPRAIPSVFSGFSRSTRIGDVGTDKPFAPLTTILGSQGRARATAELVHSGKGGAAVAQAQTREILLRADLVSGALSALFVDGVSEQIFVDAFASYLYEIFLVGQGIAGANVGQAAGFKLEGLIQKQTIDGVGPAVNFPFALTPLASTAVLGWTVDADAVGENFRVRAQGDAGTTVRWFARVKLSQVST